MCFPSELYAGFVHAGTQPARAIDEELGVGDPVFLATLSENHFGRDDHSQDVETDVEEFGRFHPDPDEESELPTVDLTDRLLDGWVPLLSTTLGFKIDVLDPIANDRLALANNGLT